MIDIAYAMGGTGGAGGAGSQGGGFQLLLPFILMFAIIYFLIIRPQNKQRKQHMAMLAALKKGDKVVCSGGLYGDISGIKDDIVTLEIAPKVRVKVARSSISHVINKEGKKEA